MNRTFSAIAALSGAFALVAAGAASANAAPLDTGLGTLIISGTIATSSGANFPDGSPVSLYGEPTDAQLDSLAEGDEVQPILLASTTTFNGSYFLRMDQTYPLTQLRDASGVVSLDVVAQSTSGDTADYHFTRLVTPRTGAQPFVGSGSGSDGVAGDTDSDTDDGSAPAGPNITALAPATPSGASTQALSSAVTAGMVQPATEDCSEKLVKRYNAKPTVVGATYVSTSDGGQAFNYTNGSSSNIGVAVSLSSSSGYKISGEMNIDGSNTNTTKYGQVKGVNSYRYTQDFNYGKFSLNCANFPGGTRQFVEYKIEPISYSGPDVRVSSSPPTATHCNSALDINTSFTQNTTTATKYGAAADLSAAATGLEISAHSGYTSSVEAVFYNNSTKTVHHLCGTAGDAGASKPGRIVLK